MYGGSIMTCRLLLAARVGFASLAIALYAGSAGGAPKQPRIETGPDAEVTFDGLVRVQKSVADAARVKSRSTSRPYKKLMVVSGRLVPQARAGQRLSSSQRIAVPRQGRKQGTALARAQDRVRDGARQARALPDRQPARPRCPLARRRRHRRRVEHSTRYRLGALRPRRRVSDLDRRRDSRDRAARLGERRDSRSCRRPARCRIAVRVRGQQRDGLVRSAASRVVLGHAVAAAVRGNREGLTRSRELVAELLGPGPSARHYGRSTTSSRGCPAGAARRARTAFSIASMRSSPSIGLRR